MSKRITSGQSKLIKQLHSREDLSYRQISAIVRIPISTIYNHLFPETNRIYQQTHKKQRNKWLRNWQSSPQRLEWRRRYYKTSIKPKRDE